MRPDRDAARGQTQRRLEPGELHSLVIGLTFLRVVAARTICLSLSRDRLSYTAMSL
jgi:hypothetical protein